MGLEDFDRVFFAGLIAGEVLIIVEVDQVGCSVILTALAVLWAVPSEVSYFSTLETGIQ